MADTEMLSKQLMVGVTVRLTVCLVEEYPPKMLLVWKHICLMGQIGTTRIDKIDTRKT